MIQDIYTSITQMEPNALRSCVRDLKKRNDSLSLEERIKLHFGLVQMDCLDSAMYQMQAIHKEVTTFGISSDFLAAHPDLKVRLMATYDIWEDACGNVHIEEVSECCCDCDCCQDCCSEDCACCTVPICGVLAFSMCLTACCGDSAGSAFLGCFCGSDSGICCNDAGGLCHIPVDCCCDCINSGCGCDC